MDAILVTAALVGFTTFLWCVLYWWPQRRIWALARRIPGPRGYPLLGNAPLLMGKITEVLPTLMRLLAEFGPVVRLWLGPRLYVLLKDPDDIQRVLGDSKIRNKEKKITKAISTFLGDGLLTLNGDKWHLHRKLITPTFHFKVLEAYVDVFGRKSKIMMEKLKEKEGKPFDVYTTLSLCTLDAICETALGTVVNYQAAGKSRFLECFDDVLKLIVRRSFRPWLLYDSLYALSSDGRQAKLLIKTIHEFSEGVIAQKLDEYRRGIRSPSIITSSQKKVTSFLDMLIEASEKQGSILSPEEIRDEVTTLTSTGLETTATAMSYLLLLIALHPEVQSEIQKEMDEVFGSDDRPASCEDIQRLPVLERCIKESLRMFPIAPLPYRDNDTEIQLPSGYTIPAGAGILVLAYATHRNPKYFPEPDKFIPDRWLPEKTVNIHPYTYIPFSAGPRNCVGQKYAQLQMKSTLSQILRFYTVTTPLTMKIFDKLALSVTLTLDPELEERYVIQLDRR